MTDHKARYGRQANWDLQREKQRRAAKNREERLYGEVVNEEEEEAEE